MNSSVRSRIIKGLGSQAISQPITFAIQVLSVPLFLRFWGIALYGEWLILGAVPAYLMISDLGLTAATTHDMSMRVARGDRDGALASFQTAWIVVSSLAGLAAIVILFVGVVTPFAAWFNFTHIDQRTASWVLTVLLVQVLANVQLGLLSAGLICEGAFATITFIKSLTQLLGFVVMAAVIALGQGPVEAALAMTLGPIAGFVVTRLYMARLGPWLRYGIAAANAATARRLLYPSLGALGFVVGNALIIQGPVLVIGMFVGPAATAVFSMMRMSARGVLILVESLFSVLRPEISFAIGKGDMAMVRRMYRYLFQAALWLGAGGLFILWILSDYIFGIWTGGKVLPVEPAYILILAATFAWLLWNASLSITFAANRAQAISVAYVTSSLLGIGLSLVSGKRLGIDGVAGALLIVDVFLMVYAVSKTLRFLNAPFGEFMKFAITPPRHAIQLLLTNILR